MTDGQSDFDTQLDAEVAALTDALLAGEPVQASDEASSYLEMARQLDHLIEPRTGPSPDFERRLRPVIEQEWTRQKPSRHSSLTLRTAIGWVVVAAVLVLAFIVIPADSSFPLILSGTAASGGGASGVEIPWRGVLLVLGFGGFAGWLLWRLRR